MGFSVLRNISLGRSQEVELLGHMSMFLILDVYCQLLSKRIMPIYMITHIYMH